MTAVLYYRSGKHKGNALSCDLVLTFKFFIFICSFCFFWRAVYNKKIEMEIGKCAMPRPVEMFLNIVNDRSLHMEVSG